MTKQPYETPPVVGRINPKLLVDLRRACPGISVDFDWRKDRPFTGQEAAIFERLEPIHRQLVPKFPKKPVREIYYSIDTREVASGESQRGNPWHFDPLDLSLLVSDFPTEFVAIDPRQRELGHKNWPDLLSMVSMHLQARQVTDDFLKQSGFRIFKPQKGEVVVLSDQLHRSPVNRTGNRIARTWIRAAIV